ncbi:hypothetical protein FH972_022679 [Carpinus fangiana]|uniref:Uncharacterized protein n=1 Tax=Carpinus fangiana TaxID=176857 RepID=A0A5N6KTG0_9ROSI|nr:hypothetical protein FH972_022679 [Carpinus fangiana]
MGISQEFPPDEAPVQPARLFPNDNPNQRLGTNPANRIAYATTMAYGTGFILGASKGGSEAALRFRAENTHRLPTNRGAWYLYFKAKNWYVFRASLKEGWKMSWRIAPWVAAFYTVEHAVDCTRDVDDAGTHKDFLATTVAGLSVAGAFSAYQRFSMPTMARTTKTGLLVGVSYGLAQDGLRLMKGENLAWVDLLRKLDQTLQTDHDSVQQLPDLPTGVAVRPLSRRNKTETISSHGSHPTSRPRRSKQRSKLQQGSVSSHASVQ